MNHTLFTLGVLSHHFPSGQTGSSFSDLPFVYRISFFLPLWTGYLAYALYNSRFSVHIYITTFRSFDFLQLRLGFFPQGAIDH